MFVVADSGGGGEVDVARTCGALPLGPGHRDQEGGQDRVLDLDHPPPTPRPRQACLRYLQARQVLLSLSPQALLRGLVEEFPPPLPHRKSHLPLGESPEALPAFLSSLLQAGPRTYSLS